LLAPSLPRSRAGNQEHAKKFKEIQPQQKTTRKKKKKKKKEESVDY
jgi:hypothetical protein